MFRDFPTFSRICIFFLLTLSLLRFFLLIFLFSLPLPCSAFHLSILSEVWLLNFLRSIHPQIQYKVQNSCRIALSQDCQHSDMVWLANLQTLDCRVCRGLYLQFWRTVAKSPWPRSSLVFERTAFAKLHLPHCIEVNLDFSKKKIWPSYWFFLWTNNDWNYWTFRTLWKWNIVKLCPIPSDSAVSRQPSQDYASVQSGFYCSPLDAQLRSEAWMAHLADLAKAPWKTLCFPKVSPLNTDQFRSI